MSGARRSASALQAHCAPAASPLPEPEHAAAPSTPICSKTIRKPLGLPARSPADAHFSISRSFRVVAFDTSHEALVHSGQSNQIPHLIGPAGVADCFRCNSGAPCRGWIPALCKEFVIPAQAGIQPWAGAGARTILNGSSPRLFPASGVAQSLRRPVSTARGGDGFPSPRERRMEAAHPHRHTREESYARVSVRGNDGGGGFGSIGEAMAWHSERSDSMPSSRTTRSPRVAPMFHRGVSRGARRSQEPRTPVSWRHAVAGRAHRLECYGRHAGPAIRRSPRYSPGYRRVGGDACVEYQNPGPAGA